MKFGRFEHHGKVFYGIVEGDAVFELDGSPFDKYRKTDRHHSLPALKVLLPCMPYNLYCAGLNYAAHIEWANKRTGGATEPDLKDSDAVEICNDQIGVLRNPVVRARV